MGNPKSNIRSDCKDLYCNYALREARINAGYTIKELADKVGVSFPTIHAYERLRAYPCRDIAEKIVNVLRTDESQIFPRKFKVIVSELRAERRENLKHNKEIPYGTLSEMEDKLGNNLVQSVSSCAQIINHYDLKEKIENSLQSLGWREREIIKLRFGIGQHPYTYTLEEVGKIFRITRDRVRQIEAKAIRKLQHPIRKTKLESFLEAFR